MADYSRTGTSVASLQDIIDTMVSFLTASGPGPTWVQDATFTAASNAGNLFLQTAGATTMYVSFKAITVDSEDILFCHWNPGTSNGYGGGAGPTAARTAFGSSFRMDPVNETYQLHLFADDERCVAVLEGTPKLGTVTAGIRPRSSAQILYFGEYTPHAGAADDPYPLIIAGNSRYFQADPVTGLQLGHWPETVFKTAGPDDKFFDRDEGMGWRKLYGPSFDPPRNSRGSEGFVYQQDIYLDGPGLEESLSLIGCLVGNKDHGIYQTITISANDYLTVPSILYVTPEPGTDTSGHVYLFPIGVAI